MIERENRRLTNPGERAGKKIGASIGDWFDDELSEQLAEDRETLRTRKWPNGKPVSAAFVRERENAVLMIQREQWRRANTEGATE